MIISHCFSLSLFHNYMKMLSVNTRVERNIDGMWFPAEIVSADGVAGVVTLRYTDDDNIEDLVPSSEVRIPFHEIPTNSSPSIDRKKTLPKPLAGLMEDDSDERFKHRPRATVHANDDDDPGTVPL